MDVIQHFTAEAERHLKAAQEITDLADAEGRSLTSEELDKIEEHLSEAADKKAKKNDEEKKEAARRRIAEMASLEGEPVEHPQPEAKSLGEAFVKSSAYKELVERGFEGDWRTPWIEFKAPGDPILEATGNNADAIAPQWDNRLYAPNLFQFPRRVAALLSQAQASGNTVFYPVVTGRTPPADATTAEAEAKKGADFTFNVESETLQKLTVFSGVSEEMMEDAPNVAAYINNQLGVMVEQAEEKEIVSTLYTAATDNVDGSTIGGDAGFDAIREAIAELQLRGFTDGLAVLLHPYDSARLQVTRAVSGDGAYFSGGPYAPGQTGPWGIREVTTPSAVEGTPLVGAFRTATLYRKGGIRTQASTGYEDYFRKDLIALRAEVRMLVAVHNPEAFIEVFAGS